MIAKDAVPITPSDTADQSYDALYVGGDGAVSVVTSQGRTVTFSGVVAGTFIPVRVRRVRSTGTTATNLLGMVP